ncbi:MAG: GPR endopeptidase, partial [bacterium]|nr:GPR endopeptidase [bacterium]
MNKEIDMKNYNVRTDLVVDLFDHTQNYRDIEIQEEKMNQVKITEINILNDNNALNKKKGRYITISFKDATDKENVKQLEEVLIKYLKKLLEESHITFEQKALIIGLGNIHSTPDALGPKTVEKVLVTKYLFDTDGIEVSKDYRNTSSFTPGVLATTGMESSDMIKGIIQESKPDFLIVIDSLASSSIDRINKTIQLTNTGINPGSGIGNNRKEISQEILKIPVIAIGVPTVIEAMVLVSDTIQYMYKHLSYNKDNL